MISSEYILDRYFREAGHTWIPRSRMPVSSDEGAIVSSQRGCHSSATIGLSEWGLACSLRSLAARTAHPLACDTAGLSPGQVRAVKLASERPLCVITGGPGTGKTTCVRRVVQAELERGGDVIQLAPTALAARRLAQSTDHPARTAHSWLRCLESDRAPDAVSMIVIDECSMMGTEIAHKVISAARRYESRVILMGDPWQLPSVDPGQILRDIIESRVIPTAILTEVHRYESGGPIGEACRAILDGQLPPNAERGGVGFHLISTHPGRIAECAEHAMTRLGISIYECRTLTATRHDAISANEQIKARFNPRPVGSGYFSDGDPIRQCVNDYDLGIVNGDIGIYRDPGLAIFDGREYVASDCFLKMAYASTCHSAQGCEYPFVCIYVTRRSGTMVTREWLNTAVSRSQRLCLLIADPAHLAACLLRRTQPRITRLREYLTGDDFIPSGE